MAKEIVDFRMGAADFRAAENGDDVRASIRLFGSRIMSMLLSQGGATFNAKTENLFGSPVAKHWTDELHEEEGWGGSDGTPFGRVGIRVIAADVEGVGFDDVELKEIQGA
ncbi:hypothetical protein D3C78_1426850 [compost metagenome]